MPSSRGELKKGVKQPPTRRTLAEARNKVSLHVRAASTKLDLFLRNTEAPACYVVLLHRAPSDRKNIEQISRRIEKKNTGLGFCCQIQMCESISQGPASTYVFTRDGCPAAAQLSGPNFSDGGTLPLPIVQSDGYGSQLTVATFDPSLTAGNNISSPCANTA